LLRSVVDYFKPQRVILFGSRARGEATRDSDIDLLVIVDDDTPPEKLTWKAGCEAQQSFTGAADVFPMRAETFEQDRNIIGTLAAEADADGIVVYGSPKGSPSTKAVDPHARWEAVARSRRCRSRHGGNLHRRGTGAVRKCRLPLSASYRKAV
jgi:hypothetical protein